MAHLPKRKTKRKRRRKDSQHKGFYQSRLWKNASKEFLEANQVCVWYRKRIKCTKDAKITDHIVSMTDGGDRLNRKNWQPMCKSCSQAKTNMEVANRKRKVKGRITPNGLIVSYE